MQFEAELNGERAERKMEMAARAEWKRLEDKLTGEWEDGNEQFGQAIDLTLWGITQVRIFFMKNCRQPLRV